MTDDLFQERTPDDHLFITLDSQQEQAVLLLATGHGQTEVAKIVGVDRRTLYTWLNEDESFQHWYNVVRKEFYQRNFERLGSVGNLALERLTELVRSKNERVSLDAVKFVLTSSQLVWK